MKIISDFIMKLLTNSGVSSNRFLGIFIFTPALLFLVFFKYDYEYVYAIISLLSALLITNAAAKFAKNNEKEEKG